MRFLLAAFLVLTASAASAQELVKNGDFSLGNAVFSTDYAYNAPATNALGTEGVYTVTSDTRNPFVLCTLGDGIVGYNDHTTGQGQFMVVNGSTTFNALVWGQTLTGLTVGQTYRFGAWISRWTPTSANPTRIQAIVGSTLIGTYGDPSNAGAWEERTDTFVATSTRMSLEIRNLQDAAYGNDFGLDDISVQAVPEPGAWAALALGVGALARTQRKPRTR